MENKRNTRQILLVLFYIVFQFMLFFLVTANNADEFIFGSGSLTFLVLIVISVILIVLARKFVIKNRGIGLLFNISGIMFQYALIVFLFVELCNNNYWTFIKVSSWSGSYNQRIAKLDACFFYITAIELMLFSLVNMKSFGARKHVKEIFQIVLTALPVIAAIVILGYLLINRPVFKG